MGVSKVMSVPEDMRPLEFMVVPRSDGDPESPEVMKAPKIWGTMRFNGSLNCDGDSEI